MRQLLHDLDCESKDAEELTVFKEILSRICLSNAFLCHMDRHAARRYSKSFLTSELGFYVAQTMEKSQFADFMMFMKNDIEQAFIRIFNAPDYSTYVSSSLEEARAFALKCALYKRYPFLASEGFVLRIYLRCF